jgi:hypothetical protein
MTYSLPVAAQYARNLGLARAAYVPSRARSLAAEATTSGDGAAEVTSRC